MFDLEKAIKRWIKSLHKYEALEDGLIADLELHLRDVVDSQRKKGVDEEEAFRMAVAQVGTAESIAAEYTKNRLAGLDRRSPLRLSRFIPPLVWNYIKIALRKIRRQISYSVITIAGLAIGMASCTIILLWIMDEMSYDRFHEKRNNIYRVVRYSPEDPEDVSALSPNILAQALKDEIPEVKSTAKLGFQYDFVILRDEKKYYEKGFTVAGDFFQIFSFPFIHGTPVTALSKPKSIVITQRMAERFFGNEAPIGKHLTVNIHKKMNLEVSGVLKNIPRNSHLQFDFIVPFSLMQQRDGDLKHFWDDIGYGTYVELNENSSASEVEQKINELVRRNRKNPRIYALQPLTRIHLHSSDFSNDNISGHVHIKYLHIFSFIAVLILVIAWINFMNLSTARAKKRAKEIGIRKVTGADQKDLVKQFFLESFIMSFLAMACGLVVCLLLLPVFNHITGKDLTYTFLGRGDILLGILGMILLTGLLAGAYPALFLSSFHPINALKGTHPGESRRVVYRKILVSAQFTFTIAFIIVAAVMYKQLQYIKDKDLGFNKENLVCFRMYDKPRERLETFRQELLMSRSVLNVTFAEQLPSLMGGVYDSDWEGKNPEDNVRLNIIYVDPDYIATFGMQMMEGRFFSKEFGTDDHAFVLNESAIQAMGLVSPVGKRFSSRGKNGTIIGVMNNFHSQSLRNRMKPVGVMLMEPRRANFAVARMQPNDPSEALDSMEKIWNRIYPDFPFSYFFLDDVLDRSYQAEQRSGALFRYCSMLAIFLACLGLFGLASFMTEQRTKEIGIRKVLGAPVSRILFMISREHVIWVSLANLVACPVAYAIMRRWLDNFQFRIDMDFWIFILSGGLVLVIALLAVSGPSIKAATTNPVDSLRYE